MSEKPGDLLPMPVLLWDFYTTICLAEDTYYLQSSEGLSL